MQPHNFLFCFTYLSTSNSYVTFTFGDAGYSLGDNSDTDSRSQTLNQSSGVSLANIAIPSTSAPMSSIPTVSPSTSTAIYSTQTVMKKMFSARSNHPSLESSSSTLPVTSKTGRPLTKMLTPTVPLKMISNTSSSTTLVTLSGNDNTQVTRTPRVLACVSVPINTTVEVCSPSLPRECMVYESAANTITDREECLAITHTVCQAVTEEVDNDICVVRYVDKKEDTTAKNYKLVFEKECTVVKELICQSSPADGFDKQGDQYCKEGEKETCYNIPMVRYMIEPVTVSYPVAVTECVKRPITLPSITCENITKDHCVRLPHTKKDTVMLEHCGVSLGLPSCQVVEAVLPQMK